MSDRQVSEGSVTELNALTQEEEDFHNEKTAIAKEVLSHLISAENDEFDKADGSDGLGPPTAEVPDTHFYRRQLVNDVLEQTEEKILEVLNTPLPTPHGNSPMKAMKLKGRQSCIALGYLGDEARENTVITAALEKALKNRGKLMKAAAFGNFSPQTTPDIVDEKVALGGRVTAPPKQLTKSLTRGYSTIGERTTLSGVPLGQTSQNGSQSGKKSMRASVRHDNVSQLMKTGGIGLARKTPLSHEKPVLKDPMGIQCVAHLHSRKWTQLARAIRETIYDPDFYDDGTYGPMYVRLAIHGAATWDAHDRTGGLEGAAMRFKPEYSDAHNKFCKPIIRRQHELMKSPFPWASYADIQCLAAYVSLECASGPVIPFTPGRRDVVQPKDLRTPAEEIKDDEFVFLNYRERGDVGPEDEPAPMCPLSGMPGECPFLRKMRVFPGRVPGPEQGHLGPPCAPVTRKAEQKELEEVAKHIREIFVDRIGASEQHTVALIAGGHSLGRCHREISGYAGPWQSNPGYFNNVYCKKLISEDWKIVDRNMVDYSGDLITGLKPAGMRRQYVNKGGKGDLMMLVSDMALREDPQFGIWIRKYAEDNELLKKDFGVAFKWITEAGFEPPKHKPFCFEIRKFASDCFRGIGEFLCPFANQGSGSASADGGAVADAPKVGDPYTLEEVKAHNSKTDCWVVINGKVCNLTEFMNNHPGGVPVILGQAGKDASSEWNVIHSRDAIEKICPQVVIGHIVASK